MSFKPISLSRGSTDNRERRRDGSGIEPPPSNRNRDLSPRDRRRGFDRDWSQNQARIAQPRHEANPPRGRQDHVASPASNAGSSSSDSKADSRSADQKLFDLLRKKDNILMEKVKVNNKLDAYNKVMQQRTKDFDTSHSRHTDYPSIVRQYERFKDKHMTETEKVRDKLKIIQDSYLKTVDAITALIGALPSANVQGKAQEELSKFPVLEAKIIALQGRLANQDVLLKEQKEREEQLEDRFMILLKAHEKERSDEQGALETQFTTLLKAQEASFEARTTALLIKQEEKHEARIAALLKTHEEKYEARFKTLKKEQDKQVQEMESRLGAPLQESRKRPQAHDVEELRQANENVQAGLSAQKRDTAEKVDDLRLRLSDALKCIEQLRASLQTAQTSIHEHKAKLDLHDNSLAQVDFDNLDLIAEGWALEFPTLKDASEFQRGEIHTLQQELESLKALKTDYVKLKTAQDGIILELGGALDTLQRQSDAQKARVEALESQSAQVVSLDMLAKQNTSYATRLKAVEDGLEKSTAPAQAPVTLPAPIIDAPSANVKSEIEAIKTEVDGLREVNENQYDQLMHIISSMQSQYDNISTMDLATSIAGVMEGLYPNTRQLSQDLEFLKSQVSENKSRLADVEKKLLELSDNLVDLFQKLSAMITPVDYDSRPPKRPRMELANGHPPLENGRHRS